MNPELCRIVENMLKDVVLLRDNAFITVNRRGGKRENRLQRDFLNVILGINIRIPGVDGGIVVTRSLLEQIQVSEKEMWEAAYRNSSSKINVARMSDLLGMPTEDGEIMYVAVQSDGEPYGANALCFPEVFRRFCNQIHESDGVLLLPSSTQELIVLPIGGLGGQHEVEELVQMVAEVNASGMVDESIQLDPAVYRYSVKTNEITLMPQNDSWS